MKTLEAIRMLAPERPIAFYNPLEWQVAPFRDKSRIMLLTGSAGGGKSRIASEKVHAYCMKYPGSVAICLRKAREYAAKSVVFALKAAQGDDPNVVYRTGEMIFHYANGSKIFIAGLSDEKQRQAVRSINGNGSADIIWCEEANAFKEDDHNELLARLRGQAADWRQIIYSTNPDTPTHWIKRRLMDGGEASVYFSKAADNFYNPAEYLDTLDGMTGVMKLRLALGKWVQADGVVYPQFSDEIHVIDSFPIPADWRRFRVIDFGYTNPLVCQWWAMDSDDRMYLYRELYHTKRTVRTHAAQIKSYSDGEEMESTVCDHDAEDRATLAEEEIANTAADKSVTVGIQKVSERLKVQPDGKPRLYLMRGALIEIDPWLDDLNKPTSTIAEMPGYVWQKTADGKPVKEQPRKENDHGADAMRYAVMYADSRVPIFL